MSYMICQSSSQGSLKKHKKSPKSAMDETGFLSVMCV